MFLWSIVTVSDFKRENNLNLNIYAIFLMFVPFTNNYHFCFSSDQYSNQNFDTQVCWTIITRTEYKFENLVWNTKNEKWKMKEQF